MTDSEDSMALVYQWLDEIPFTRPKRNVSRDFSDGVLMAELLKHFYPRLVDLHNYSPVNRFNAKVKNWQTLNKKVLVKLNLSINQSTIDDIASGTAGALDGLLIILKNKTEKLGSKSLDCDGGDSERSEGNNCEKQLFQEESVPLHVVQILKVQLQNYKDTITNLNQKILHLEKLLEIKDNVINELKDQLERCQRYSEESQNNR